MRARLPLRLARSAVFTVVCVGLAVLGHRAAGGTGPATWAVAGGSAGVTLAATLIAGRERSPRTIIGFLIAAQVVLHELFGASGGAGSPLSLHVSHGQGLGAGLGMVIAHLTATLMTGWWLAQGESALWSVLRRMGTRALVGLSRLLTLLGGDPAALLPRPTGRGPRRLAPPPAREALRHTVTRRGPPLPATR
ncbi:MFS transporter [Sphaerisporangium sp. NPDC005288]|uniref:MFS transporter n=1 Tax=Sphaerisporangium sp. NPDC005288 TaxID=3155114 RepID=UPI0033A7087A